MRVLQTRGIFLDGSSSGGEKRLLLQIFSLTLLGAEIFVFIQRKADDGFGEGNFHPRRSSDLDPLQALLYESEALPSSCVSMR